MSFDFALAEGDTGGDSVSIPFEQGYVFRHKSICGRVSKRVSIPFEQGYVFRHKEDRKVSREVRRLNPFRTGLCLSTLQRYAGGRNHAAFQTHFPIFLEG